MKNIMHRIDPIYCRARAGKSGMTDPESTTGVIPRLDRGIQKVFENTGLRLEFIPHLMRDRNDEIGC